MEMDRLSSSSHGDLGSADRIQRMDMPADTMGCIFESWARLEAKATGFFTKDVKVQHCTKSLQIVNFELEIPYSCGDTLIDERDGKKYATVRIGDQCWMAKNLNIGNRIDGVDDQRDNFY